MYLINHGGGGCAIRPNPIQTRQQTGQLQVCLSAQTYTDGYMVDARSLEPMTESEDGRRAGCGSNGESPGLGYVSRNVLVQGPSKGSKATARLMRRCARVNLARGVGDVWQFQDDREAARCVCKYPLSRDNSDEYLQSAADRIAQNRLATGITYRSNRMSALD
jgi:hypothetical protein